MKWRDQSTGHGAYCEDFDMDDRDWNAEIEEARRLYEDETIDARIEFLEMEEKEMIHE